MKVTCKYCGIVEKTHQCPYSKRKYDSNREDKKVYRDGRYRQVREQILKDYNNTCILSLLLEKKVRVAEEVHHIVEINDDITLAYDYENLIPLTEFRHTQVHLLYKKNKEKIQDILRKLCDIYQNSGSIGIIDTPLPLELREISP